MGTLAADQDAATSQHSRVKPASGDRGRFASLLCGLTAAWIAAGSTGLLGHTLRHALALFFLAAAFLLGLPSGPRRWTWRNVLGLGGIAAAALALLGSPHPPVNVMAVALVLASLAWLRSDGEQTPFLVASVSVLVLGLYRFAVTSIPWLWSLSDQLGAGLSSGAGFIERQPLRAGATYGGIDFLVLTLVLFSLWLGRQPAPRAKSAVCLGAAILAAHLNYLALLAHAPKILALLPAAKAEPAFGVTPPWDWVQAVRTLVPWNLPAVGALLHLVVAACLFKTLPMKRSAELPLGAAQASDRAEPELGAPFLFRGALRSNIRGVLSWLTSPAALVGLALLLPVLASLNARQLSLEGKKIVVHEKGFLNWLKPKHGDYGRLSVGMYGMLPELVQLCGATCLVSPDLSEADLAGAHLLVLIFPNKPWTDGQLERIWNFVRQGGSLLVLGEHTVREKEGGNRFNDVLKPSSMRVAFDSAMFEVGGWLESYEALSHPATLGLRDHRNEFGVVIGASVEARWPARPFLVGRYGFSDPGDASNDESKGGSMMGNHKYDAGEKLGDQLLAAEQRFGRGRIMVFGDTSGFYNGILPGSHNFVTRLFAVLCEDAWVSSGRLLAATLGLALLLAGLWQLSCSRRREAAVLPGRPPPRRLTAAATIVAMALGFALSLSATALWTHRAATVLPNGGAVPNRLAYIDASHLELSSSESWREDGIGGLQLTLMRNGYVVLGLHEFDAKRLKRCGLFISTAPSRRFTRKEIRAVREFVEGGGTFICTAGWPEAGASRELLADLGFYVGGIGAATSGQPEPKPFGHFKAPYFNGGDYMAYVRFHAAWNVESTDPNARPIAYGPRDPKGPPDQPDPSVILMRSIGQGKAVVVADSDFATNKNLEREGGQPFEGMRENADFWRWLLADLNGQPAWTPPRPLPATPGNPEDKPIQ